MSNLKISNSEIQAYKDCRRKWWLTYYQELALKVEPLASPKRLGTKIHDALAGWYADDTNPMETLANFYKEETALLEERPDELKKLNSEWELAIAMIEGYLEWLEETGEDSDLELIAVESVIEVDHPDVPGVTLRGKLDARFRQISSGLKLFMDHKTVQSIDQEQGVLSIIEQPKFYYLLEYLESQGSRETNGALWNLIRRVKRTARATPPFYHREMIRHNKATLESTYMMVTMIIKEIVQTREKLDAGVDHRSVVPPRPSRDCTWKCPFVSICGMFDDGSNVQGLLEEYYEHQDPHERYLIEELKGETS